MSDWFSTSIKLQKQLLDAHKASLDAGRKMTGAGEQFVKLQETGRQIAQANMAAMNAWAKLWGLG